MGAAITSALWGRSRPSDGDVVKGIGNPSSRLLKQLLARVPLPQSGTTWYLYPIKPASPSSGDPLQQLDPTSDLCDLIIAQNWESVEATLRRSPTLKDKEGTALLLAVYHSCPLSTVKLLHESAASPLAARTPNGRNVLHWASAHTDDVVGVAILEFIAEVLCMTGGAWQDPLPEHGVRGDLLDKLEVHPFHIAANSDNVRALRFWVEVGKVPPDSPDGMQATALHYAANRAAGNALGYLVVNAGADVHAKNRIGERVLDRVRNDKQSQFLQLWSQPWMHDVVTAWKQARTVPPGVEGDRFDDLFAVMSPLDKRLHVLRCIAAVAHPALSVRWVILGSFPTFADALLSTGERLESSGESHDPPFRQSVITLPRYRASTPPPPSDDDDDDDGDEGHEEQKDDINDDDDDIKTDDVVIVEHRDAMEDGPDSTASVMLSVMDATEGRYHHMMQYRLNGWDCITAVTCSLDRLLTSPMDELVKVANWLHNIESSCKQDASVAVVLVAAHEGPLRASPADVATALRRLKATFEKRFDDGFVTDASLKSRHVGDLGAVPDTGMKLMATAAVDVTGSSVVKIDSDNTVDRSVKNVTELTAACLRLAPHLLPRFYGSGVTTDLLNMGRDVLCAEHRSELFDGHWVVDWVMLSRNAKEWLGTTAQEAKLKIQVLFLVSLGALLTITPPVPEQETAWRRTRRVPQIGDRTLVVVDPGRLTDVLMLVTHRRYVGVNHQDPESLAILLNESSPQRPELVKEAQMMRCVAAEAYVTGRMSMEDIKTDETLFMTRQRLTRRFLFNVLLAKRRADFLLQRRAPSSAAHRGVTVPALDNTELQDKVWTLLQELEYGVEVGTTSGGGGGGASMSQPPPPCRQDVMFLPFLSTLRTLRRCPELASRIQTLGMGANMLGDDVRTALQRSDAPCSWQMQRLIALEGGLPKPVLRDVLGRLMTTEGPDGYSVVENTGFMVHAIQAVPKSDLKEHVVVWVVSTSKSAPLPGPYVSVPVLLARLQDECAFKVVAWYEGCNDMVTAALCYGEGNPFTAAPAWAGFSWAVQQVKAAINQHDPRSRLQQLVPVDKSEVTVPLPDVWTLATSESFRATVDSLKAQSTVPHMLPLSELPNFDLHRLESNRLWFCGHCEAYRQVMRSFAVVLSPSWYIPEEELTEADPEPADADVADDGPQILGRGHFGDVTRCKWGNMDVVKKTVRTASSTASPLAFLEYEVRALTQLAHPNVVKVLGLCPPASFVMEYVAVGDLRNWLRDMRHKVETRALSPVEALAAILEVLRGVAAGMEHVHSRGLVHCDLKPSNILMEERASKGKWVAKIADFGLAVSARVVSSVRRSRGTPGYMAPELVPPESPDTTAELVAAMEADRDAALTDESLASTLVAGEGDSLHLVPASDVWSFGVVACNCLALVDGDVWQAPRRVRANKVLYSAFVKRKSASKLPNVWRQAPDGLLEAGRRLRLNVLTAVVGECLDADPGKRPSFEFVQVQLKGAAREAEELAGRVVVAEAL